jgi:membrane protease YdiL (CAAX protease family)
MGSEFINSVKNMLDALNKMVDKTYANLLTASNIFELIFVVIVVAVVPAISEEAMFRGFIQRSFELKLKPYLAILLTAIFFSAYHFNPYGFIPLFILGAYFGFTAYMTRSLVIPVILHFLNNFSAVLLYHILGNDELLKSDTAIKGDELSSYLILLVVLTLTNTILLKL